MYAKASEPGPLLRVSLRRRIIITCSRWGHLQGIQSQRNSLPSPRNQLKKIPFHSPGRSRRTKDRRSRNRMPASCSPRPLPLDCVGTFCLPAAGQAEGAGLGQMRGQVERHVAGRTWQLFVGGKAEEVERRTQMVLLSSGQGRRPMLRARGEQRRRLTLELGLGRRRGRHSSHCKSPFIAFEIFIANHEVGDFSRGAQ